MLALGDPPGSLHRSVAERRRFWKLRCDSPWRIPLARRQPPTVTGVLLNERRASLPVDSKARSRLASGQLVTDRNLSADGGHHCDLAIIAATRRTISFFRFPVLVLNGYDIAA
jgi:hypothetical protein